MCFTLLTVRCCLTPIPTGSNPCIFSIPKWSLLFPLPQATVNADLCPELCTAFEQPNRAKQIRDWEIQPPFSPVTVGTVCLWALFPAHSPSWITTGNSPSCLLHPVTVFPPQALCICPFLSGKCSSYACFWFLPSLSARTPWQTTLDCAPQLLYPI